MVISEQRRGLDAVSYLYVFVGLYTITVYVEDFDAL